MERINIEQFDMANEQVLEKSHLYIELTDTYLVYAAKYVCKQPIADDKDDHSLGWEEIAVNFHIKIKREHIVSLERNWVHKRRIYDVQVEINGYPASLKFYFQTSQGMLKVYKKLDEYIFGKT